MADDILQEVTCTNCQNPIDLRGHGQQVACEACGSRFILRGHLCPQCHSYHAPRYNEPRIGACCGWHWWPSPFSFWS